MFGSGILELDCGRSGRPRGQLRSDCRACGDDRRCRAAAEPVARRAENQRDQQGARRNLLGCKGFRTRRPEWLATLTGKGCRTRSVHGAVGFVRAVKDLVPLRISAIWHIGDSLPNHVIWFGGAGTCAFAEMTRQPGKRFRQAGFHAFATGCGTGCTIDRSLPGMFDDDRRSSDSTRCSTAANV